MGAALGVSKRKPGREVAPAELFPDLADDERRQAPKSRKDDYALEERGIESVEGCKWEYERSLLPLVNGNVLSWKHQSAKSKTPGSVLAVASDSILCTDRVDMDEKLLRARRACLENLFGFLNLDELGAACCCCKVWCNLARPSLLKSLPEFHGPELEWIQSQVTKSKALVNKAVIHGLKDLCFSKLSVLREFAHKTLQTGGIESKEALQGNRKSQQPEATDCDLEIENADLEALSLRIGTLNGQYATYPELAMSMVNGQFGNDDEGYRHAMHQHRRLFKYLFHKYKANIASTATLKDCWSAASFTINSIQDKVREFGKQVQDIAEGQLAPIAQAFCDRESSYDGRSVLLHGIWENDAVAEFDKTRKSFLHLSRKHSKKLEQDAMDYLADPECRRRVEILQDIGILNMFLSQVIVAIHSALLERILDNPSLFQLCKRTLDETLRKKQSDLVYKNYRHNYGEILGILPSVDRDGPFQGNNDDILQAEMCCAGPKQFKLCSRGLNWIEREVDSLLDEFIEISFENSKELANRELGKRRLQQESTGWFLQKLAAEYKSRGFANECKNDKEMTWSLRDYAQRYYVNQAVMKVHATRGVSTMGRIQSRLGDSQRRKHLQELSKALVAGLEREFGHLSESEDSLYCLENSMQLDKALHTSPQFVQGLVSMGLQRLYKWQAKKQESVINFESKYSGVNDI